MKIALVILHADPARGGAERYTMDLAEALAKRGVDVFLLATSFAADAPGRRVHLATKSRSRLSYYLKFLDALEEHLRGNQYDIVHAMLPVRRCDVYHPHAGIAVDTLTHGHLKHAGAIRRGLARLANRFNHKRRAFADVERELLLTGSGAPPVVLCLSDYIKDTIRRHHSLPDAQMVRLFNAVDLTRFDPAARPDAREQIRGRADERVRRYQPDQVLALMIAQDYERKGLREAILALRGVDELTGKGWDRLVLAVIGKQSAGRYLALAHRKGVYDRVDHWGATNDPYAWYRAADFFVLPTRHDPCSLVVLEALAMGVPVISTIYNGACEIMTDGVHGFVLKDPSDVDALRECYRKLLDAPTRQKMSEACLALRPQLSQERHVDRLLEIYENRIAQTHHSRRI